MAYEQMPVYTVRHQCVYLYSVLFRIQHMNRHMIPTWLISAFPLDFIHQTSKPAQHGCCYCLFLYFQFFCTISLNCAALSLPPCQLKSKIETVWRRDVELLEKNITCTLCFCYLLFLCYYLTGRKLYYLEV